MPFKPGQSGNIKGRPKTSAPTTSKDLREAIAGRSIELVNKLMDVALIDGDVVALKYLLDKVIPNLATEQPEKSQTNWGDIMIKFVEPDEYGL